jgi:uncharacterized protein (TIGR00290 family)
MDLRKRKRAMREKVAISWSGGKDCCLALHKILLSQQYDVHSLHTTFNENTGRVGLHGIRQTLIEQQANSLGIRLDKISIPSAEDHDAYELSIKNYYQLLADLGIRKVVFGDIYLEDLRAFRDKILAAFGLQGIYPLWKKEVRSLATEFIESGFKAIICSADNKFFDEQTVGTYYDYNFINTLPDEVDPCGENGEFHTFVFDGSIFKKPITIKKGELVSKEYHYKINLPDGTIESKTSKFWFQELE